jgi:hypothetical protein
MTHFKATENGQIHFTDEEEAEWQAEQDAYLAAAPVREKKRLIDLIANMEKEDLLNRGSREMELMLYEFFKLSGQMTQANYDTNPYRIKLMARNAEIATLRAQLAALG